MFCINFDKHICVNVFLFQTYLICKSSDAPCCRLCRVCVCRVSYWCSWVTQWCGRCSWRPSRPAHPPWKPPSSTLLPISLPRSVHHCDVMTGNNYRITGPLCKESTGGRWIPLTKGTSPLIDWRSYSRNSRFALDFCVKTSWRKIHATQYEW